MESNRFDAEGEKMIGDLIAAAGPGETASAEAKDRVYAATHRQWQTLVRSRPRTTVRRRLRNSRLLGVAAGLAAMAVVLYWLQSAPPDASGATEFASLVRVEGTAEVIRAGNSAPLTSAAASPSLGAGDSLRTGPDGRLAIELRGGASLRVNVDTELRLDDASEVELVAGTIYIDSGTNGAAARLEITTPFGSVQHIGTQYELRLDGQALRLRVREGAIVYLGATEQATAMAGEQLDVSSGALAGRRQIAPDDADWNWAGELAALPPADVHELGEVLSWIARESGLTLEYTIAGTRDRLASAPLFGVSGFNPDETLGMIERTTDVRFEIRDGSLIILN
jgi:ferric-dicitrate binding protein FerR (iron transport regulator)